MFIKLLTQCAIFFSIYLGISWWQMSDMLKGNIIERSNVVQTYNEENNFVEKSNTQQLTQEGNILLTTVGDTVELKVQGKPVVIYFFAPWCQVCHFSINNLERFYLNNPNVDVIAVALDYENEEEVINFTLNHQLTFPVAFGSQKIKQHFKISAYPSYYVIDLNNNIKKRSVGYSSTMGLYFSRLFI